jgi:hypothetical protein
VSDEQMVSVTRVINHPPEKIFDLLASPAGHLLIDGSGMVRDRISGSTSKARGNPRSSPR